MFKKRMVAKAGYVLSTAMIITMFLACMIDQRNIIKFF